MRKNLCSILLTAALGLASIPSAAQAETFMYQFRGQTAFASFSSTDASGCITTWFDANYYESRYRSPSGPTGSDGAGVDVYYVRYDHCQYRYLDEGYGYASVPADAFTSTGALQSAHLATSLDLYNWSTGSTVPLTLDVTWTGVGDAYRSSSSGRWSSPHYRSLYRSKGTSREAEATGTAVLGGEPLAFGPALWGSLGSSQSGTIYIYW